MKALFLTGLLSAMGGAAFGILAAALCRSAADADRRMSEAARSDSLDVQRELAPEIAA